MNPGLTVSQQAGQSIAPLWDEWQHKTIDVETLYMDGRITRRQYERKIDKLVEQYWEAIQTERKKLHVAEWSGWKMGEP